jgi:hypothetical protein
MVSALPGTLSLSCAHTRVVCVQERSAKKGKWELTRCDTEVERGCCIAGANAGTGTSCAAHLGGLRHSAALRVAR